MRYDYYAITKSGYEYTHYSRERVFDFYQNNHCVELGRVTLDLFPTKEIIYDRADKDTNNINRKDLVNMTTVAMRKAIDKYDKNNTKQIHIKLNKNTDKEIIEYLEGKNINGLFKDLVLKEIKKSKKAH